MIPFSKRKDKKQMEEHTMKKLIAILLAVVMVFALGVSALADELDIVIAPGPISPIHRRFDKLNELTTPNS